ncbi:MAG: FAD-dependent oxidoreductase [Bradyrhizobium sp.]|nr:MAG: FAD-dependent oxidoreductase [Bradyrhizobium sp.]
MTSPARLKIAVVGTGISGLSAAWLLHRRHDVVIFEKADRIGGHSNTVHASVGGDIVPVDTGFIVYNPDTYPNFVELLRVLDVESELSDMSFGVSLEGGGVEYCGDNLAGLFAQRANLLRPRFWSMVADITRFYRRAADDARRLCDDCLSLGDYLAKGKYGAAFRDLYILPLASAIWSAPTAEILSYPAAAFLRFQDNHGLLRVRERPDWVTIKGGSERYVKRLIQGFAAQIRTGANIAQIERVAGKAIVVHASGEREAFDHIVIATHPDQALALLADPTQDERAVLGAFRYSRNEAVLHTDETMMPRRRAVWSSWNATGGAGPTQECASVTYWMNRLQNLPTRTDLFVTLNPMRPLRDGAVLKSETYEHPIFDAAALAAQKRLWDIQGGRHTWYCGAYFGAGFHEDGLQAGLAVAELLGDVRRPWRVADESARIPAPPEARPEPDWEDAA